MKDSDAAEYRVVREYLCRLLHDANTGKICPDDSDPTKYGAMADALLGQADYGLVRRGEVPPWMVEFKGDGRYPTGLFYVPADRGHNGS